MSRLKKIKLKSWAGAEAVKKEDIEDLTGFIPCFTSFPKKNLTDTNYKDLYLASG